MKRDPQELIDNPIAPPSPPEVEVPVTTVIERLNRTEGSELELTTRATPATCKAAAMADVYGRIYGISFVSGQVSLMMRLAVSADGRGRADMIEALRAGGSLPPEYYSGSAAGTPIYEARE